jgi:hypothetical protein
MRFMMCVVDDASSTATPAEMDEIDEFNERLRADGFWLTAAGLVAPSESLLIDNRNDAQSVAQPSLMSHGDFYSGFWLVDVPDAETARLVALQSSRACNRRVELRPYL